MGSEAMPGLAFFILITCFSYSPANSAATAMRFEGFGATLYTKYRTYWVKLLGAWHGPGMDLVLVGLSTKRGVVPGKVTII
jgi:hypothetical protein